MRPSVVPGRRGDRRRAVRRCAAARATHPEDLPNRRRPIVRRGPGHGGATTAVRANTLQFLERFGLPLLLVLLIAFFAIDPASSSVFRSSANVRNILGNQAVTAIVALAMVVPLVGGYFDLSVSAITGAANVAVAALLGTHGWPIWAAVAVGVGLGASIGLVNGLLVARLRLNGFVVTLGTYTLLLGIIQYY